jgi:hypothetical protein
MYEKTVPLTDQLEKLQQNNEQVLTIAGYLVQDLVGLLYNQPPLRPFLLLMAMRLDFVTSQIGNAAKLFPLAKTDSMEKLAVEVIQSYNHPF